MAIRQTIKNILSKIKGAVKESLKKEFVYPYQPKSVQELKTRTGIVNALKESDKRYKMMEDYKKGIMNQDMFELVRSNIIKRRNRKNQGR